MRARTPNYRLKIPVTISYGIYDIKTLPSGSFVRPISEQYVPQHILDDPRWEDADLSTDVFCYTKIGIVLIPKRDILEE